jgi:ATP-binding cassette subfamily B protein
VRTDALTGSARTLAIALARLGAITAGVYLIFHDQLTPGSLVAFLAYVGGIVAPVQSLTTLYQTVRKGVVGVEMMRDILESPSETPDAAGAHALEKVEGELRFENVGFSHQRGRRLIHGFDLHVRKGETVALMGPSGSGKTTLTKLLLRMLPLEGGRITIDGHDIREVTAQSLRRNIAYVAQDTHLFNDTVAANIAYGKPGATRAEIEAAARAAHAHEFIVELPDRYDTRVGEAGGLLSGGQRQRLAIARALLKDAPILVMDEATASLDAVSEAAVQESLERLRQGRTTLFAAHRLSTAVKADRIVVLDGGVMAASGTHDQLLRSSAYYSGVVAQGLIGLGLPLVMPA